jgi:hypothetical protein
MHPAWSSNSRTGPIRRHKQQVWFACEGLIALYDERKPKEDYVVLTPGEFRERAEALNNFAEKMPKSGATAWQRQESKEMVRAAQDMEESIKEARNMGDPSDPRVRDYWARHRRNNTVSMSSGVNWEHGKPKKTVEQMAKEAKGTKTTEAPLTEAQIKADLADAAASNVRRLPVKKPRKGALILDL